MKKAIVLGAVLALFGLSACNDFSSPQGVVGTAYHALKTNNPELFNKTLKGDALLNYGNLNGMAKLQDELKGLDVMAGNTVLVSTDPVGHSNWMVKARHYTVDVMGKKAGDVSAQFARVLTANVDCEVSYDWERDYPMDGYPYPYFPGPHGGWYKSQDASAVQKAGEKEMVEYSTCLISALN
jgi:hypothetical protein